MLEQRPADQVQPVKGVDERLARARVAVERPDVELAARYRQVERRAVLRRERQVDDRGQAGDLAARQAVCAGLGGEGLDAGRDERVDGFGRRGGEEHVGRARVEDDVAALGEHGACLAVDGDLGGADDPVPTADLVREDEVSCGLSCRYGMSLWVARILTLELGVIETAKQ